MTWTSTAKQIIFDRYFSWCLGNFTNNQLIELEFPVDPRPRFGYGKPPHPRLNTIFDAARSNFSSWISRIAEYSQPLYSIAGQSRAAGEPSFENPWFLGLDAAALYTIVATQKPRRLIEVGSGNSTKFARRAIRDTACGSQIISIDPQPRAEVAALCDEAIRLPLEQVDLRIFQTLDQGDILFIDNSHYSFSNTDVTVFFLEILPNLKAGVIIHLHDIFLPLDYRPEWRNRYYSEQYLLACWLLAGTGKLDLMLSNAFVSIDAALSSQLAPFWDDPRFDGARRYAIEVMQQFKGYSFWARVAA